MGRPWRLLTLAAGFSATVGVGTATSQTIIVRNAGAGSSAELVLNADRVATATPDASGDLVLSVNLSGNLRKSEADARVTVDTCGSVRRVFLVEAGRQP